MIVHVRLHTTLRKETPQGVIDRVDLHLDPGATVADVLTRLEIRPRGGSVILEVNGKLAEADHILHDGDQVRLVPSVSGGAERRSASNDLASADQEGSDRLRSLQGSGA